MHVVDEPGTPTADASDSANAAISEAVEELLQKFRLTKSQTERARLLVLERSDAAVQMASDIVTETVIKAEVEPDDLFALAVDQSESLLKRYATLDISHRADISRLKDQMTSYVHDPTRKRPFNALMLASPGAGKSHFIHQLAEAMKNDRVEAVTFNMATMQSPSDMAHPLDLIRNVKVNDGFPLLFLDEFDSDESHYATLLPLLWEGELHLGHRDLKIGKAMIILAGSNPNLPKKMTESSSMRTKGDPEEENVGKLTDLMSRINGEVIEIPPLDLRTEYRDRRVDKVCITVSLLRARFGPELKSVPRMLLRFIAHTRFRYSVRSIAHLIDTIDSAAFNKNNELVIDPLALPMASEDKLQKSSLPLHLIDNDGSFGILNRWKELRADVAVCPITSGLPLPFMLLHSQNS